MHKNPQGAFEMSTNNDSEFPESYTTKYEIKSPLSILYYNMTTIYEDDYPAKMPFDFAKDMILWYSNLGDTVYDGCAGSGTVIRVASKLGRIGIYNDVNTKAFELAKTHAKNENCEHARFFNEDARKFDLTKSYGKQADLILSSLPFGLNIIGDKNHYSDHTCDISNATDYSKFFEGAKQIIASYYANLKPNGIMILDGRDRFYKGQSIFLIMEFFHIAKQFGFEPISHYYYQLIPYRQLTYKDKPTGFVKAMPTAMEAIVLRKPVNQKLVF